MYCKLCGKHLYEKITFQNLFKYTYHIHDECEKTLNKNKEYVTFPLLDKLVFFDYLFEHAYEKADRDFLFDTYAENFYDRMFKNNEWSIVIFVEGILDSNTAILVTKLADNAILFCSIFYENFL